MVEQFKNGSFATMAGASPGACDSSDGYGPGSIAAGHTGSMHGYFIISGVGMQTSTDAHCDAVARSNDDCTTATFVNTHFTPCYPFTCTVTTFFDHYSAGDQGLAVREWKNASCDRGGNHGDIADLVRHGTGRGLCVSLTPSGTAAVTEGRLRALQDETRGFTDRVRARGAGSRPIVGLRAAPKRARRRQR